MKILYAASEALPFASTGGLADVMGALPAAVKASLPKRSEVVVIMPLYRQIKLKFSDRLEFVGSTYVNLSWRHNYCGFFKTVVKGVSYYFVDNEYYYARDGIYGYFDDGERFAFFCKCVMEFMSYQKFYPDILHCNDWHTALCSVYLKRLYSNIEEYSSIKCVFTIHNVGYPGKFSHAILGDVFDLPASEAGTVDFDGSINLMKGAIVTCDSLTTVSPRYAEELRFSAFSGELCGIICQNGYKLKGIINGIDYEYYDPRRDTVLAANYCADDLSGKEKCREYLLEKCGFEKTSAPVVACVSRLAPSTGFDLLMSCADELLRDDIRLVVLGTGERYVEDYFRDLAYRYKGKVAAFIAYDKNFSKQIYAGADLFLMPSKTEPCGLSQMIAARYGTPPVVRETGGLADSIRSFNELTLEGNGFSFADYSPSALTVAVRRACAVMRDDKLRLAVIGNAIGSDFSWNASAAEYLQLYRSLTNKK
ncbi:MAG: glycogen synthase [Clostridia bacterium]|nr:glycogen synthase [Clostridia bacterium]